MVFLSDTHIGGDPGRDGSAELVLAGDFFDFLQIGGVPPGENRASATISRPEYRELFSALRDFAAGEGRRVVYLPGNHDSGVRAELWEHPRPAPHYLRAAERIAILGRLPAQPAPDSTPRVTHTEVLPRAESRPAEG